MKSHFFSTIVLSLISTLCVGLSAQNITDSLISTSVWEEDIDILGVQNASEYVASVVFPVGYQIGDYVEFVKVAPTTLNAAGYYEISITYTRHSVAAAATHIASISHANPNLWREAGRVNANSYVYDGWHNFTVDCNTASSNPRFRIRAINTYGDKNEPITVQIKIRSINITNTFTGMEARGNDLSVSKYLPMTNEWDLFVGNPYSQDGAKIGFKVKANGNVGIGTANPTQRLTVNGTILAKEVKVETEWADFVFDKNYQLPSLLEVEKYILQNGHLPGIPTEKEVEVNGVNLGEMNVKLLQKVEELTLYLIQIEREKKERDTLIEELKKRLEILEKKGY